MYYYQHGRNACTPTEDVSEQDQKRGHVHSTHFVQTILGVFLKTWEELYGGRRNPAGFVPGGKSKRGCFVPGIARVSQLLIRLFVGALWVYSNFITKKDIIRPELCYLKTHNCSQNGIFTLILRFASLE